MANVSVNVHIKGTEELNLLTLEDKSTAVFIGYDVTIHFRDIEAAKDFHEELGKVLNQSIKPIVEHHQTIREAV